MKDEIKEKIQNYEMDSITKKDWRDISFDENLPEDSIRKFQNDPNIINWKIISMSRKNLSEEFIREFKDRVNWFNISMHQTLSEDFIREFKDRVNWNNISKYQKLSEGFIREFQDKINWIAILMSRYQHLSEEFIREFF